MNREELTTLAPEFDWTMLLERLQLGAVDTVMARETSAIADAGRMLSSVPLDTWKDYSAHHFIRGHAEYLGLIRFRGHFPKGGYDVHTDGRDDQEPAAAPAVR